MQTERIHTDFKHKSGYQTQHIAKKSHKRLLSQPLDALAFDTVEITEDHQKSEESTTSLMKMITTMSDKEVAQKMKKYRDSFATIDDALVDKFIMEGL